VKKALWDMSYGLYIVSSKNKDEKFNGQVVNTAFQVTAEPARIAVCINKENLTYKYLKESKVFSVSVLEKNTPMTFIGKWGFKSGRDIDKFLDTDYYVSDNKIPVVKDYTLSVIEAKIIEETSVGTHTVFIGEVINQEVLKEGEILTYEYYQKEKKGKAPKTAPTFKK
jgi:ferric-chelate reductase [NAD(P)H]